MTRQPTGAAALAGGTLSIADASNRRRYERKRCDWPAEYSLDGHHFEAVRIVNVSKAGMGLSSDVPAAVGQTLNLILKDIGAYVCRIAWKSDTGSGVEIIDNASYLSEDQVTELGNILESSDAAGLKNVSTASVEKLEIDDRSNTRDFAELQTDKLEALIADLTTLLNKTRDIQRTE